MRKIQITLEVTETELLRIANILNGAPAFTATTTSNEKPKEISSPAKPAIKPSAPAEKPVVKPAPKPGGKKAAKMPSFGRSQAQINDFLEHESKRVEAIDEKEAERQQRAEEKAAREAEELAEVNKAKKVTETKTEMPKKFWEI